MLASDDDEFTSWAINESCPTHRAQNHGCCHCTNTFWRPPRPRDVLSAFAKHNDTCDKVELPYDMITIVDEPAYPWRSLMIDTGRRLFPLPFVRSIIDAMAMTKLNVLQLHLNDMGRFAWESKVFPVRTYCSTHCTRSAAYCLSLPPSFPLSFSVLFLLACFVQVVR